MKKVLITITMAVFLIVSFQGAAIASPVFMFEVKGNDPGSLSADQTELEALIAEWFLSERDETVEFDLKFYAKADAPGTSATEGSGLTITYTNEKSGGWNTEAAIDFFSVKAGNGYALYWIEGGAESGEWNTVNRDNKAISHLSTWKTAGNDTPPSGDPVPVPEPEPSTIILLGFGLFGLAVLKRKRK